MALTIPVLALNNTIGQAFREIHTQVTVLLAAAFLVFLVGLLDDIRSVPAKFKLLCLVGASLLLCSTGSRIESITLDSTFELHLGWLSWPVTMLWIIGITVAMNFIDGLDGLAAGIAAIVCGVIAILAFSSGQIVMGVLMLSLVGSLTGFLFFNFNPAKIFMGDCGSMFLGFMIAGGSVVCQAKTSTLVGLALPALALGVPLTDTLLTIIRRKVLDRRSIFAAEGGHIHHRLLEKGLNQRYAVFLIYAVTLAAAGIGMLMFVTRSTGTMAVIGCAVCFLVVVFRVAGAARIRETIAAFQRNSAIAKEVKQQRSHFEEVQLQLRNSRCFADWWQTLCGMADRMEFDRLALVHRKAVGRTNMYVWRRTEESLHPNEIATVTIPLSDGKSSRIELSVRTNTSLESVGRRVSLFGRLIDERSLASMPQAEEHNEVQVVPEELALRF
ncbi:MAG: undecaprenyl/decaprenyl-phosphate alpha-N-acetylglucosaminyl 1-phosphate transferase [Planctomycetes bacterium]|nr:undecaprenyl/decaprenyl-phosphate alpha-N-acetylglucosaminyl 1-phosphate transferase [Planctomycetota bacterium]